MKTTLFSITQLGAAFGAAWLCMLPAAAAAQDAGKTLSSLQAPDLDLSVKYFNRELNKEGVLHESSYEEIMLRRNGHVWTERVIPKQVATNGQAHTRHERHGFDYITLPRHVKLEGGKPAVEFVDRHEKQIIQILPSEFENVNFDGSWLNAYYLIDPQLVATMPVSLRTSTVAHARWHEVEKNSLFQRVLWDEKSNIPLIVETGNRTGTFFQRITISTHAKLTQDLPWNHLQKYTQKEYSDFLD